MFVLVVVVVVSSFACGVCESIGRVSFRRASSRGAEEGVDVGVWNMAPGKEMRRTQGKEFDYCLLIVGVGSDLWQCARVFDEKRARQMNAFNLLPLGT